jgi:sugar (pentulose or hexulose) kinase
LHAKENDLSYLGIDLGTSEVKLVLTDDDSRVIATSASLRVDNPHPLWSEQAPQAWWNATLDAIAALRAEAPQAFQALRGIGISGQMHGATLLDRNGNVLRPAILWNDMRAHAEWWNWKRWCRTRPTSPAIAPCRLHGPQAAVAVEIRTGGLPCHRQGLAARITWAGS